MKRLNGAQMDDFEARAKALAAAKERLEEAFGNIQDEMEEFLKPYREAIDQWIGALTDAREFAQDVVQAMEDYEGERSDAWFESSAAQDHEDWKNAWAEIVEMRDLEDPLAELVESAGQMLDEMCLDISEEFEGLPTERG